jgi:hypothetical protein
MIAMERAVHMGYLRAHTKGFAEKRERRFRHRREGPPRATGPNLAGWRQLAAFAAGQGRLQTGGERLVA